MTVAPRPDLVVTTALKRSADLEGRALTFAAELRARFVPRRGLGLPRLFESNPEAERVLIVQTDRLLLANRAGGPELFYHPNLSFLRLGNMERGGRDLLVDAAELRPGDSVLDATLGFASEAIICAHVVGDAGEVHGVEAVPELGVLVREGLKTVETDNTTINAAMRRVQVVHLGHHLEYLRACPDRRFDVVCFDPFFEEVLAASAHAIGPLRRYGSHERLLPEAVAEARRVARRRVLIKAEKWVEFPAEFGVTERVGSRSSKVTYGVVPALGA